MNKQVKIIESGPRRGIPWWGWILISLGLAIPLCGVGSALAVYGVSKYVRNAKAAEARSVLGTLTAGVVRCAASPGSDGAQRGLPPSSNAVPRQPPSAGKYQSTPEEWATEEAFRCAGFSLLEPQYFAYRWESQAPTHGVAMADGDLDGDGTADTHLEQGVTCTEAGCAVGPVVER